MNNKIAIYGAMSVALGIEKAFKKLYPEKEILGFVVSKMDGNPAMLDNLSVMSIDIFSEKYTDKDQITFLIGAPEVVHPAIIDTLKRYGFNNYIAVDWKNEENYMTEFYAQKSIFPSVHNLKSSVHERVKIYVAESSNDTKLSASFTDSCDWLCSIQAGAVHGRIPNLDFYDDEGDNISDKNGNYSELSALYWIWKHIPADMEYCGMFQYRRFLNISVEDWYRIKENDVDVVLPLPTIHWPDICEHHQRYISDSDWEAMIKAMEELSPEYVENFKQIMKQEYLYNYNIIVAKPKVLQKYCEWLFPILERTEELSNPKGAERSDRYIGYLGENLATLYFLHNAKKLKIYHTGRIMLV